MSENYVSDDDLIFSLKTYFSHEMILNSIFYLIKFTFQLVTLRNYLFHRLTKLYGHSILNMI